MNLEKSKDLDSIGYYLTEHLRVAGAYWSLTALECLKIKISEEKKRSLIDWLKKCQNEDGGFGGNTNHDSHMTSTHYAVLVLIQFDAITEFDTEKIANYVASLQNKEEGNFLGDSWGETDIRFTYCAISCLTLLNHLNKIDLDKACQYVQKCKNFDGSVFFPLFLYKKIMKNL